MARGWISKKCKEKNNSLPSDDLEHFAKDGEYATKARREKIYKKLRIRIPINMWFLSMFS